MPAKNETPRSSKQPVKPNPNELPRGADPAGQQQQRRGIDRDAIARRAYERFEKRGRQPGHDQEDWLEAERELKQGHPG